MTTIDEKTRKSITVISSLKLGWRQRAHLILTLVKKKPMTFVDIYRHNDPASEIEADISSTGLICVRQTVAPIEKLQCRLVVASTFATAEKLIEPKNSYITGLLLGYPETAVKAYAEDSNNLLDEANYPEHMQHNKLAFAFSKNDSEKEIAYVEDLMETLRQYAPEFFEEAFPQAFAE